MSVSFLNVFKRRFFKFVFSPAHLFVKNRGALHTGGDGRAIYPVTLPNEVFSNLYQACGGRDPCEKSTPVELEFQNPYNRDVSV